MQTLSIEHPPSYPFVYSPVPFPPVTGPCIMPTAVYPVSYPMMTYPSYGALMSVPHGYPVPPSMPDKAFFHHDHSFIPSGGANAAPALVGKADCPSGSGTRSSIPQKLQYSIFNVDGSYKSQYDQMDTLRPPSLSRDAFDGTASPDTQSACDPVAHQKGSCRCHRRTCREGDDEVENARKRRFIADPKLSRPNEDRLYCLASLSQEIGRSIPSAMTTHPDTVNQLALMEKIDALSMANRSIHYLTQAPSFGTSVGLSPLIPRPIDAYRPPETTRSYGCHICGKKFGRRYDLQRHILCHTDDRPWVCQHCQQGFRRKDALKVHLHRIHAGEGASDNPAENSASPSSSSPKSSPKSSSLKSSSPKDAGSSASEPTAS